MEALSTIRRYPVALFVMLVLSIIAGWLVSQHALLAGVLVFVGTVFFIIIRDPFQALGITLLLMPFHTIADRLVSMATESEFTQLAFSSWKEMVLLSIFVVMFLYRALVRRELPITPALALAVVFAGFGLLFIPTADGLKMGLLEYRYLYEGVLMLLTIYALRPPLKRILHLFNWMLAEGVALSICGFITRYVLDYYSFLQHFGFINPEMTRDDLLYASVYSISGGFFVRASSIFGGPNESGLYLAILMTLAMGLLLFNSSNMSRAQRRWYALALAVIGAGELITISRSSWLLTVVALLVMSAYLKGVNRKIKGALVAGLVLIGLLVAVPNLWRFALRTVTLVDTSALWRAQSIDENLRAIMDNPIGIGLGNASYKFYLVSPAYMHTEFYIFIIALELGWLGLALYILMNGAFLLALFRLTGSSRSFERRLLGLISASLLVGALVIGFTSAITLEWIFQAYLWFFIGAAIWGKDTLRGIPNLDKVDSNPCRPDHL
jgi:hypothetical protein